MDIKKNFLVLSMIIALFLGLAACGKKGPPRPPGGEREFQWTWTRAELKNNCLSIQGGLQGNLDKFYEVILELQPSGSDNFCEGCPFLPMEREHFSRNAAMFKLETDSDNDTPSNMQTATVSITYCPDTPSPAYQWRMLGINVYQAMPNALTPIQYISTPLPLQ